MNYGERLRQIREKGNLTQSEVGKWEGIQKQGISNREKKDAPVMGLDAIGQLLKESNTDARFLFGQIEDIGLADLRIADAPHAFQEMFSEYKRMKAGNSKSSLAERIEADPELKECLSLMIENRGLLQRVMGYIDRLKDERQELQKGEPANASTA